MSAQELYQVKLRIINTENAEVFFDNFSEAEDVLDLDLMDEKIFPKLKAALQGLHIGDSCSLELQPEDAYGFYMPELVREIELDLLPEDLRSEGIFADFTLENGEILTGLIMQIEDDKALIDFNSPLSSKVVSIECQLKNVKQLD